MFKMGETALNNAAFDFLDIMSNYREHVFLCTKIYAKKIKADGKELIKESKISIFSAIVTALDHQEWALQKNAAMALHTLFGIRNSERTFVTQEFQSVILEGIPRILKLLVHDRSYRVVGGAAALLALSDDSMLHCMMGALYMLIFLKELYGLVCVSTQILNLPEAGTSQRASNYSIITQTHGKVTYVFLKRYGDLMSYHLPSEDVHKILDKLFAAMEESPHHRGAIKFPEVHGMPVRSAWVTSIGILSCVFYIPCGLTAMLAGWAIDKTETSPT
jgi:hypothetical protein